MNFALLFLLPLSAQCYSTFRVKVPNGDKVKDCDGNEVKAVGHVNPGGGGPRNVFGHDFKRHGLKWTPDLCNEDSDGDGVTNGYELGDPTCIWKEGDAPPSFDRAITHPGQNCNLEDCDGSFNNTNNTNNEPSDCDKYEANYDAQVDFTLGKNKVAHGTSYMNQAFKWPENKPSAVVKFEVVNRHPQVVHHLILFRCPNDKHYEEYKTPKEKPNGPMLCQDAVMGWAVGAPAFCMPEGIALVLEPGTTFTMEMHYDNPNNLDITDDSGMRISFSEYKESSGLIRADVQIGGAVPPVMQVPPNLQSYRITSRTSSTRLAVQADKEVTVLAVMHHLHQIGRKQWATFVDDETGTAEEIACDTNYDFDLQKMVLLPKPIKLTAGKRLEVDCVYDSRSRKNLTRGGDRTEDEMCIFAFMYYPYGAMATTPMVSADIDMRNDPSAANKVCRCEAQFAPSSNDPYWVFLFHGLLMWVAWALLLPAGASVPLGWRKRLGDPLWFKVHQGLQTLGLVVTLIAWLLAVQGMGGIRFDSVHHRLGHFIVVIGIIQAVFGYLRPPKPHTEDEAPSDSRRMWLVSHRVIAVVALAASLHQVWTGGPMLARKTFRSTQIENIVTALALAQIGRALFPMSLFVVGGIIITGAFVMWRSNNTKANDGGIEAVGLSSSRQDL